MLSDPARDALTGEPARDGFERLFRAVYVDVYRYCVRRLGLDLAEETAAETLATVYAKWDKAPAGLDAQRAWVFGFARNKVLEAERAQARSRPAQDTGHFDSRLEAGGAVFGTGADGDPGMWFAGLDQARSLLARLPDGERDATYLTAIEGFTAREAAAMLGCSVSAVTSRVSSARKRLIRYLAEEGGPTR